MDAACTIQDSIHVFSLVHKYVSRILGTYQTHKKIGTIMLIPNCMIKIKESYTLFLFFMNSSFPYIFVKRSSNVPAR